VKRRAVPVISKEELSTWPTKRLLGRLNALRRLEESLDQSDIEPNELTDDEDIQFKSDHRWADAYKTLKSLLDNREHVPSGREERIAQMKAKRR
jgi:hypothetical protein